MMTKTIREMYDIAGSPFVFDTTVSYPTITGNTSNFLTDYAADQTDLDAYFVHKYGDRLIDLEADTDSDAATEFGDIMESIQKIYLKAWARLYYALSLEYNPVFNVEEHITNSYGAQENSIQYGLDETTHTVGARKKTDGQHTDATTDYSVASDSGAEKEVGKSSTNFAQHIIDDDEATDKDSRALHTDTTNIGIKEDTVDRIGNIGLVSPTDLLEKEQAYQLKKSAFFKNVFLIMIEESGAYYESIPF